MLLSFCEMLIRFFALLLRFREILPIFSAVALRFLEPEGELVDIGVEPADDADEDYAHDAEGKAHTGVAVALESGYRLLVGLDIHGLDDEQIVVEGDDGVDQRDEHKDYEPGLEGGHKHEELAEEASKGRDARKTEQAERHEEGELGVGAVVAVVVADEELAATLLGDADDEEHAEVGGHIDEQVVNDGGEALRSGSHNAEHEVTGLADGGEGHESLQIVLAHREDVGQGDTEDDDPEEDEVGLVDHGCEDLIEYHEEHEGGGSLGDDAEVRGDSGRSSLIGVGCPEVEGHEANLKADTTDEEHEGCDVDY